MAFKTFNSCTERKNLLAAKNVFRYLATTADYAIEYGGELGSEHMGPDAVSRQNAVFVDSDWATDELDRKSVSGFLIFLYGGLISWFSVKQKTIALSSTKSEYMGLTHVMKECLWMHLFIQHLQLPSITPFPLLADSLSALKVTSSKLNSP